MEVTKDLQKTIKYGIAVVLSAIFVILLIASRQKPESSFGSFSLYLGVITLGYIIYLYYPKFKKSEDKENKLPPPIKLDEFIHWIKYEMCMSQDFTGYITKIYDKGIEERGTAPRSQIGFIKFKMEADDTVYYVACNLHFFKQGKIRVLTNPTDERIERAKIRLASYPEEEPDTEERVTELDMFGRPVERVKKTSKKEKQEKKKEDLE